ncbi:hypothetical protein P5V15_002672 [Pogonomyrmex californicus]
MHNTRCRLQLALHSLFCSIVILTFTKQKATRANPGESEQPYQRLVIPIESKADRSTEKWFPDIRRLGSRPVIYSQKTTIPRNL